MKSTKKFIKKAINEYLNEKYILKEGLDLADKDNVVSWIEKNGPESILNDDGDIDWNYTEPMGGDDLETLIYSYMEKYNEVISEDEIDVYRMVLLDSINDLDLNNIGVFWSFDENGVGAYGTKGDFIGKNPFVLNATIKTQDIDWEQGLYSFLLYGKSEFECYVKKGSECLITHINDEELSKPINGIC